MYAIIKDGGRQYKVSEGQELVIDYRDVSSGDALEFDQVVALSSGSKARAVSRLATKHLFVSMRYIHARKLVPSLNL